MCDLILPPSPQWYCSKVIDFNRKGVLVFGARHDVFVLDASSVPPTYKAQCCLHKERISSLALNENNICCSASEDGKVKVWDIDNTKEVLEEHNQHSSKIGCIGWSCGNSPVVVSGDDRGLIVCWQYQENRTLSYSPESGAIVCLVCSNLNETQVAVGYRSGVILILDIREWKEVHISHRLRGHDEEVLSLAWCPVPGEDFKTYKDFDDPNSLPPNDEEIATPDFGWKGHLLASSSRDKTVRIWSSGKGLQLGLFKSPKPAQFVREDRTKMWSTLLWNPNNANQIYVSSFGGEILRWSLDLDSFQKPASLNSGKVLCHTRPVFCMCVGGADQSTMCTVSMDRQMIFWDLTRSLPICAVPTLGGFVYVAKTSPIDPGRVAIGVGDSMIRLWNMNNANNSFDVTLLWQGIRSKVTALCWHPVKEGQLCFGTDDGRVGVFDTLSNKSPSISSHYHRKTVYIVAWGPPCSETENGRTFVIYSVGDGIILSHDPKKFQNEAQNVNSVIFKTNGSKPRVPIRSEISWNPDFSFVAIGNDDGSVEVYKPPLLKLMCVIHIHHKLVNSIQWHPTHNIDTTSGHSFYIATGSNEATIQVVDLSSVLGKVPETNDEAVLISEAKYTLFGHSNRIVGLQWSPHDDNRLVSVSFDGTARVWEVNTGHTIASYHGHRGRLLCVQWSGSDPDVIFTGGEDFTFHKWRISKNPHSAEDDVLRKKKTKSKGRKRPPREDDKATLLQVKESQQTDEQEVKRSGKDDEQVKGLEQSGDGEIKGFSVTLDTVTRASLDELIQLKKAELEDTKYKSSEGSDVTVVLEEIPRGSAQRTTPIVQQSEVVMDTAKTKENKECFTKDAKRRRLSKPKSYFPLCGRHENRGKELVLDDIVVLTQSIYKKSKVEKLCHNSVEFDAEEHISLGFYLPERRGILQCLTLEGQYHKDHDNMDYCYQLEIWKGNINDVLRQAREREELSDWLVAMAPLAAFDTWTTVCEDYATQLEQEGQYHKAATYLLAAHKVYSAIDLFKRHRLFKEAIALAKVRLSPIDPVLEDLYTLWAQQLTKDGNFEQAAKCHLAMQHVQNAAVLLARRYNCTASLHTAARISIIANEKQSGMAYAHKLLQQFLLKWEWSQAYTYLKEQSAFQALIAVSGMHELVAKEIQNHHPEILCVAEDRFSIWPTDSKLLLPDFILDNKDRDTLSPWKPWLIDGLTFPHHVLRIFYSNLGIIMDTESLEEMYKSLSILQAGKQSQEEILQLLIQISVDLVLCMLSFLMSETPTAISHLIHAISSLQEAGHYVVMETIIQLFLPLGPKYMLKLQQEITAMRVVMSMENKSSYDGAAKVHTIKRYSTEIKDEESVSCGGLRCRELDCLRAYYYLAILNSLSQQQPGGRNEETGKGEQTTTENENPSDIEEALFDSSQSVEPEGDENKPETECTVPGNVLEDVKDKKLSANEVEKYRPSPPFKQENCHSALTESSVAASESCTVSDIEVKETNSRGTALITNGQSEVQTCANVSNKEASVRTESQSWEILKQPLGAAAGDYQRQWSDSSRTDLSQLTISQLCHLSRGLLWDIQGKRYALMETLGYIHKAISQLLLAQKPNSLSSSQTDIHNETKATADFGHGSMSLLEEERDILPGGFSRQPQLFGVPEDTLSHFHEHHHHKPLARSFSSDSRSLDSDAREHICPTHSAHDSNPENSFDIICVSCEMLNKSRKVLWEDEPHLGAEHSGKANLTNLVNPAKYINVPDEWYNMSADQKYSMPYVTMAILKDEQEYLMHELKRGPENLQVPFPNPLDSVKLLLNVCQSQLRWEDSSWFAERVVAWALKFSVSTQQKENLMDLFHRTLTH